MSAFRFTPPRAAAAGSRQDGGEAVDWHAMTRLRLTFAVRRIRLLAATLAVLAGAPPLAAQEGTVAASLPPWAAEPPPRLPGSMDRTLDRYRYFTDCIASREWVTARPLFDTAPGSREQARALDRITGGGRGSECSYADRMRMTAMLLRGGIAESRYRLVYGRDPVPPVDPAPAPVPAGASFAWVDFNRESPGRLLHAFARCLAEREAGGVHAVLTTRIGRRGEREAYQALSRRFGACLAPGQRLRANSLTLRPWLAEAAYQRARAGRPDEAD